VTEVIAAGAVRFDSDDEVALEGQIERWLRHERPRLGEVLLDLGIIEPDALFEALAQQAKVPEEGRRRLGEQLVAAGTIDDVALAAALSRQFGVPLADLRVDSPSAAAVELIPEELARTHRVLPLRVDADRVQIVSADPYDVRAIRALTHHCGRIALLIGAGSDIERHLDDAYNVLKAAGLHIQAFELAHDDTIFDEAGVSGAMQVDESAPIVQVVNRVVTQGVRSRASDIHVEPTAADLRIRYRIDGAMTEAIRLPRAMAPGVASRIKVMAELNIVERRRPQDGQFGVQVDGRPIDVRCSVVPTVHGEKVVLRLLDKTRSLISLNDLGMSATVAERYREIARSPLGMILCTGPTGSGKTTTLYATLGEVNDPTKNVVTIEDPVEYQFEGITQMPVTGTGIGFAEGLRGILRQDPDVILVGEIRDEETARIAMQAALTGHLVLSSLHAVDSVAAVHRFTDMGIEPFLVASAMSAVVGQRLLRRICTACAEEVVPTSTEVRLLERHTGRVPARWVRGRGCNLCAGTGFRGRIGVYELLEVTDTIRDLIVAKATHHEIRRAALAQGMRSMQSQAFELVGAGLTTVDDVVRSVYAPGMDLDEGEPVAAGGSPTPPPTTSTPIPIPTPTSTSTPPPSPSPATAAAASGAGAAGEGRPADERLTIVLPAGDPFAPPGSAREAG
jgi:type IV pilus assembly protein PilB